MNGAKLLLGDFKLNPVTPVGEDTSTIVRSDALKTTLEYMAPEEIAGRPGPASDQYALGALVYTWLAGGLPFAGQYHEIAYQHLATAPLPLRQRNPAIPGDVEEVVRHALAKEPRDRFGSVRVFALALRSASGVPPMPEKRPSERAAERQDKAGSAPRARPEDTAISAPASPVPPSPETSDAPWNWRRSSSTGTPPAVHPPAFPPPTAPTSPGWAQPARVFSAHGQS